MNIAKSFFSALAVSVGLVLAGGAPVGAASLISNGGFETGSLGPWYSVSGSPVVTMDDANTGTYSVASFSGDQIRQDFAATATSLITEVSVWVKRIGGAFNLYSFYYDDSSVGTFTINNIGGTNGWAKYDLTGNLAAGKNLTGFSIYGTSPGPAYLDDFVIATDVAVVPLPASLPLLLAGMGGFVMLRRRSRPAA